MESSLSYSNLRKICTLGFAVVLVVLLSISALTQTTNQAGSASSPSTEEGDRPSLSELRKSLKKYRRENGRWPTRKADLLKTRYMDEAGIQTFQQVQELSMTNDLNGRIQVEIRYRTDDRKLKRLHLFLEPRTNTE